MLEFPEGFFEKETREGFQVETLMKSTWAAELEVLSVVAEICEKHHLTWYADWGTLLGAVRHKGFIPWDDDMDISLMRKDYEKLIKVLPSELPDGFAVAHGSCGERQKEFWTGVTNAKTISTSPERLRRFHGCPFIVSVDVFPIDVLPDDHDLREFEESMFILIAKAVEYLRKKDRSTEEESDLRESIATIEDVFHTRLMPEKDMVTQLWKIANKMCESFGEEEGENVVLFQTYMEDHKYIFKKEWFQKTIYLPFEMLRLPAPSEYDKLLKAEYGEYWVPVQRTQCHEYPFYKEQLERLKKALKQ